MLRVPTYIAPSRIAGLGLFAAADLPEGTVIWQFDERADWAIPPEELERFPEPYLSLMRRYLYLDANGLYILCGDNAKFMNHDEAPNCSDSDPRFTIAIRGIETGEELTCDYREFDLDARMWGVSFG